MKEKSNENWEAGKMCLSAGHLNAAVSRFYYAVFQAVLLWAKTTQGYDYDGVGEHRKMCRFVASHGKARRLYGTVYEDLMDMRVTADYYPDVPNIEDVKKIIIDAEKIKDYFLAETEEAV